MPSLFSRSRTQSSTNKALFFTTTGENPNLDTLDEFGKISGRPSDRGIPNLIIPTTSSKKEKKKAKEQEKRVKSATSPQDTLDYERAATNSFPDGSFLPLNLERPKSRSESDDLSREHDYGYLSHDRHVVLGVEQVSRLVEVVAEELEIRGVTEPFIFSSTALDISSSAIKRLIRSFLNTCQDHKGIIAQQAESRWREEAQFAGPHELGMCLRWGLARVIRSVGGHDIRGLVPWESYLEFRDSETEMRYPTNHFEVFLDNITPPLQPIVMRIFSLLARLTANSVSSGHTPPTLSPLFGPLFFGLGPATLAFHHAYLHYLRSVNAIEHLLLSFIRWKDTPRLTMTNSGCTPLPTGSMASLGVPIRLKEWIKGYPAMLTTFNEATNCKPQARKNARTVRIMSVRRNVRMYSPDLVNTAASWAYKRPGTPYNNELTNSKEWDRISPPLLKLTPRYSEMYKKRMDMAPNVQPYLGAGFIPEPFSLTCSGSNLTNASSTTTLSATVGGGQDYFGLTGREGDARFRSLTDQKWGEFESMGFEEMGNDKQLLNFDLTQSARSEQTSKRATLSWNDFSTAGFSRNDVPLSATLQFSAPVTNSVTSWPAHSAEINKKLKRQQKALPAFGWDTDPVVGNEEVIEEAFLDVFCDLIYGGGWMDLERGEELDRDCNWALIEFKALPINRTTATGGSDPRTSTSLILFEEFVPLEYRKQLAVTSSNRRRLPSLFSPSKTKQWKQAATLNGRPYVVGHVPRSPSYREVEFEGLLRGATGTKVITLGEKAPHPAPLGSGISNVNNYPSLIIQRTISKPLYVPEPSFQSERSDEMPSGSTTSLSFKKTSRFKLPGGIPVPSPGGIRKSGILPAEYSTVEFETRMASHSDDEHTGGAPETEAVKQKRRESRDDSWVDILVNSQNQRLVGQDAELQGNHRKGIHDRRSDFELAGLEVAQALLAAVQNGPPSPSSFICGMDRVDRDNGMDDHVHDLDVVEIDTVPRVSKLSNGHSIIIDDIGDEEVGLAYDRESEFSGEPEGEDDEEPAPGSVVLTAVHLAEQKRRLGYFDLHPERRANAQQALEDDPRLRLALDNSEDDHEGFNASDDPFSALASPKDVNSQAVARTPPPISSVPVDIQSASSHENSVLKERLAPGYKSVGLFSTPEKTSGMPLVPSKPLPSPSAQSKSSASVAHVSESVPPPSPAAPPATAPVTPSKTAALIEMYRDRERGVPPRSLPSVPSPSFIPSSIIPLSSRLPVRSPTVSNDVAALRAVPLGSTVSLLPKASPMTPPLLSATPTKEPPRSSPSSAEKNIELPFEVTGRPSPARYVHGAPLHNVVEEEEEE